MWPDPNQGRGWGGEEKVGSEKNHDKEGLVGRKICRESCQGNPQAGRSRPRVFVSKIQQTGGSWPRRVGASQ